MARYVALFDSIKAGGSRLTMAELRKAFEAEEFERVETVVASDNILFAHPERPDDGLELVGTAITNAVRCVPPENKPTPAEINTCRSFLVPTIGRFPNLKAVLALGAIGHQSTVKALGGRLSAMPFKHGGRYTVGPLTLFSSYHCSRYNTNTGVLTEAMFVEVFEQISEHLRGQAAASDGRIA